MFFSEYGGASLDTGRTIFREKPEWKSREFALVLNAWVTSDGYTIYQRKPAASAAFVV